MIVVTSETIANHRIVRTLGLVRGNTVRARHVGKGILAGLHRVIKETALGMPTHDKYIQRYCKPHPEYVCNNLHPMKATFSLLLL